MTLKERIIVEVYTGYVMTIGKERNETYKYMAEICGRPIFTHDLAREEIINELHEKSKHDFIKLCEGKVIE